MLKLSASEEALVPRGASLRLFAHRLASLDHEQAKLAGPAFERAWAARHGNGGQSAASAPSARLSAPTPTKPMVTPQVSAATAETPPAIAHELEVAAAEKRAAAERTQAVIAKAAAEFEAKRKADEEEGLRLAAIEKTWTRAYGLPYDLEPPARRTAADIWARVYAQPSLDGRSNLEPPHSPQEANSGGPAASDDVWRRAYSVPRTV